MSVHSFNDLFDIRILNVLKVKKSTYKGRQYISFLHDHFSIEESNESHFCLVSKVLESSLSKLIDHRKQLRETITRTIDKQFVQVVVYLHSKEVYHEDTKSCTSVESSISNIVVDLIATSIVFQLHNFDT